MPSKSAKQHRFMEMVANDPAAAKRVGVPQSVGREFANADEAKREQAGATKGRATQAHAKGKIHSGQKSRAHSEADRDLGYTFHTHKGN